MISKLYSQISLENVIVGTRFLGRLPSFLRRPTSSQEARAILHRRFERREENFLDIVKQAVYEHAASPYRQLLKLAGCEYGDLERLVSQEGVEGALHILYRHGVYITVDEFKGRRPATRGNTAVEVSPDLLRNPLAAFHVPARSSGSRSAGTPVLFDLAFIRGCGVNTCLSLEARGGAKWLKATWETPGAGARFRLLKFSSFGAPPVRWFSQLDPIAPGLYPTVFLWSERAMRWGSRLARVSLPGPLHVPLNNPLPIAHWMTEVLRAGHIPYLFTFPSSAVRLCQAAYEAGVDLHGAQFTLGGEPITEARLTTIRRIGAEPAPRYGSIECGPIGYGCLKPEEPDDVHLLHDLHALIQSGEDGEAQGIPPDALFISSLHPKAPFVMLNVSMGDCAAITKRTCHCPLEGLGWVTHLHKVRSYEKLTGGGMTFMDTDIIRVLEEEMPARFGGVPTDYQLLEEEAEDGQPRLRLLVHPRVGPLDTGAVAEAFLTAIGSVSVRERVMESLWRDADILRVERDLPLTTHSGKILHLHIGRSGKK